MENNIEEDIKILKELGQKYYKNGEIKIKALSGAKYIWALQNLLSNYKRVLKENEELKENYKVLENAYMIDSIPKSVIQDKIEEIINNSTFGCVGCEWNDIEVVQLLENILRGNK